jgi:hypothetical protein
MGLIAEDPDLAAAAIIVPFSRHPYRLCISIAEEGQVIITIVLTICKEIKHGFERTIIRRRNGRNPL